MGLFSNSNKPKDGKSSGWQADARITIPPGTSLAGRSQHEEFAPLIENVEDATSTDQNRSKDMQQNHETTSRIRKQNSHVCRGQGNKHESSESSSSSFNHSRASSSDESISVNGQNLHVVANHGNESAKKLSLLPSTAVKKFFTEGLQKGSHDSRKPVQKTILMGDKVFNGLLARVSATFTTAEAIESMEVCKEIEDQWGDTAMYHVADGNGTLKDLAGNLIYTGSWRLGKRHGNGSGIQGKGTYTGQWKHGNRHGNGEWKSKHGSHVIAGSWREDLLHGYALQELDKGEEIYSGSFSKGKRHGRGKLIIKDDYEYDGSFFDGLRDGFGVCVWVNSSRYEGDWHKDRRHGQGVFTSSHGAVFEGSFEDDERSGYGELKLKKEVLYKGYWKENLRWGTGEGKRTDGFFKGQWMFDEPHHHGFMKYSNGAEYHGEWLKGKPHGFGKLSQPDGKEFEGNFVAGLAHGEGVQWFPKFGKYVGVWSADRIAGEGVYVAFSGRKIGGLFEWKEVQCDSEAGHEEDQEERYVGLTLLGKKWGRGTLWYKNGDVYDGEFKAGNPSGKGTKTFSQSSAIKCYDGFWLNGAFSGKGTLFWPSGATFSGNFRAGKRHGQGSLRFANGNELTAMWKNDAIMNGDVVYTYSTGDRYEGPLINGKRQGKGTLFRAKGMVLRRTWSQNEVVNGYGEEDFPDGSSYKGNFIGRKRHGHGTMTFNDGSIYTGSWVKGKAQGNGRLEMTDGIYSGQFHKGARHGIGIFEYSNGCIYFGAWDRDKRSGLGSEWYAAGPQHSVGSFFGFYALDQRHGLGVFNWRAKFPLHLIHSLDSLQSLKSLWKTVMCQTRHPLTNLDLREYNDGNLEYTAAGQGDQELIDEWVEMLEIEKGPELAKHEDEQGVDTKHGLVFADGADIGQLQSHGCNPGSPVHGSAAISSEKGTHVKDAKTHVTSIVSPTQTFQNPSSPGIAGFQLGSSRMTEGLPAVGKVADINDEEAGALLLAVNM